MSDIAIVDVEGAPVARGNVPAGNLPEGYIEESIIAIHDVAHIVMFRLGVTRNNRDLDHVGEELATIVASGEALASRLPWFEEYYRTDLREISSEAMGEEAICVNTPDEMLVGLVFGPGMRIEAHTDVWAINANLYLKAAEKTPNTPPELAGGTVIGHKNAKSHSEILRNPLAVVAGKVGTLTVLATSEYPHTIGVAESPANFEAPDITHEDFWNNPSTRISMNMSYATERQLAAEPWLLPMNDEVGYSIPVLGKSNKSNS